MTPAGAIFLSYASQDTEPARRIAEVLRQAGLEVWFDQSELRGGDAWDALIRRHVKECALFVPIISANTESRSEGYFRLEWKLAVDRSHLLADDRTFLMPVVVDDTREASARVPEGFHARQWTRLPNGETTPQFISHVQRALEGPNREARAAVSAPAATPLNAVGPAVAKRAPAAASESRWQTLRTRFPALKGALVAIAGVGAVLSGLAGYWTTYKTVKVSVSPAIVATALPTASADATPQTNSNTERAPITTATRPERKESAPRVQPQKIELSQSAVPERKESAPRGQPQKIDLLQPAVLHAADVPQIQVLPAAYVAPPQELAGWNMRMELAFWESIKGSPMVEDYEEYLKQYPDGRFAGLARNRVKSLRAPKR